jgi:hypothetical protein
MKYFKLITVLVTVAIITPGIIHSGHTCPFDECPYKGAFEFTEVKSECEVDTDCYLLDVTHFNNPSWTYDQCEAYIWGE